MSCSVDLLKNCHAKNRSICCEKEEPANESRSSSKMLIVGFEPNQSSNGGAPVRVQTEAASSESCTPPTECADLGAASAATFLKIQRQMRTPNFKCGNKRSGQLINSAERQLSLKCQLNSAPQASETLFRNRAQNYNEKLNRKRERLFGLLSKVPVQVGPVASWRDGHEKQHSRRKQLANGAASPPLLIKYYHEHSLGELLNLHFDISLDSDSTPPPPTLATQRIAQSEATSIYLSSQEEDLADWRLSCNSTTQSVACCWPAASNQTTTPRQPHVGVYLAPNHFQTSNVSTPNGFERQPEDSGKGSYIHIKERRESFSERATTSS